MADVEPRWCESCNSATCDPSNHPDRVPLVDGVPVAYGEPHAEVARLRAIVDRYPELLSPGRAVLAVPPGGVKMLRETLCVAQGMVLRSDDPRRVEHGNRLGDLIDECDRHRPLGRDGKHGSQHTATCGCDDEETS